MIAIAIAIIGGEDLNVSYMVGLAFAVAASANFPALLLALTWRRFNTTGAVTGVLFGVISSVGLVLVGPDVGERPDHRADPAGDHLGPARVPRLLHRHDARPRRRRRRSASFDELLRPLRDRARRRGRRTRPAPASTEGEPRAGRRALTARLVDHARARMPDVSERIYVTGHRNPDLDSIAVRDRLRGAEGPPRPRRRLRARSGSAASTRRPPGRWSAARRRSPT